MSTKQSLSSPSSLTHEDRIAIVREHFEQKGYRVHSGLQFGCELVLYADSPGKVHSDFCVHVPDADGADGQLDWRNIQTLVRSMPDLRKTLIIAHVREMALAGDGKGRVKVKVGTAFSKGAHQALSRFVVDELAIATEHAPFRHKNIPQGVGTQVKPQRKS